MYTYIYIYIYLYIYIHIRIYTSGFLKNENLLSPLLLSFAFKVKKFHKRTDRSAEPILWRILFSEKQMWHHSSSLRLWLCALSQQCAHVDSVLFYYQIAVSCYIHFPPPHLPAPPWHTSCRGTTLLLLLDNRPSPIPPFSVVHRGGGATLHLARIKHQWLAEPCHAAVIANC